MCNKWKRIAAIAAIMGISAASAISLAHARLATDEARVKVSYIYNFMKFVEWPETAISRNYIVCVLGSNPFGMALEGLSARTIRDKPIRVVTDVPLEQTRYCHVVFVSRSESGRLTPILLRLHRLPVLSISDIEGFADKGGVIELITGSGGDISFRVSPKSAEEAGLRVSSKLLSLGR